MARQKEDILYRGRRRWNGNHGRVYWDNELVFEISKFEAKITSEREDVIIGISVDSKQTNLKGEGTITIKPVINRNLQRLLEEYKAGHDPRSTIVAVIDDPDAVDGQEERISFGNVWFNELPVMMFEKGKVVEKEIPFGFTPEDSYYLDTVE